MQSLICSHFLLILKDIFKIKDRDDVNKKSGLYTELVFIASLREEPLGIGTVFLSRKRRFLFLSMLNMQHLVYERILQHFRYFIIDGILDT